MSQFVQVVGALSILAAFTAAQLGRLDVRGWPYLWLNAAGATVLALDAWHEQQWGFALLEGVWALVSAAGLLARWRADQAQ
jgi:hypothetical protein